ncbi:hypothetical protein PDJAM_G00041470 [Pangasius djambal]|uniref:Uncharacterized protein n=1 Tax=Pangasius djambal TaxID=1691987 RepID=A0ACC5YT76_9TELE|nr:hypothetical protein [Pangasius djambal]
MAAESDVLCEIEVLQSIYLDELTVTRNDDGGWRVSVILHPSTGEDCLAQFVRLTLTLDLDSEQEDAAVTAEFKRKWAELQKILERQREKGGVIDPEAESNRFLIHINHAPAVSSDLASTDAPDPDSAQPLPQPLPPDGSNQNPRPLRAENTSCPPHRRAPHVPHAPHAPHGRRQQMEFRGGRRDRGKGGGGRGGHVAHAVPPPVLENLAKLSVSAAESSRNGGAPQDTSEHRDRHLVEVKEQPRRALADESVETSHQETPETKPEQHVTSDGAQTGARERGTRQERDRGRRQGPRGPPYSHRHERNAPWDNGGNVHHHHHRGARGHRASHHRGNGKSWYQRNESEFRKEGVL